VIICENRPNNSGFEMAKILTEQGIVAKVILDSAVALAIHEVDFVLSDAEAVV